MKLHQTLPPVKKATDEANPLPCYAPERQLG